jgi:hypothetical protein
LPRGGLRATLPRDAAVHPAMTQQYLAGQFSVLLEDLRPPPGEWLAAVGKLRDEVEHAPVSVLPLLADEALGLTDLICWAALEQGDVSRFCGCSKAATALREFAESARLLPE